VLEIGESDEQDVSVKLDFIDDSLFENDEVEDSLIEGLTIH
jgi:uncharacterized protein YfkK (UPF0435 family)